MLGILPKELNRKHLIIWFISQLQFAENLYTDVGNEFLFQIRSFDANVMHSCQHGVCKLPFWTWPVINVSEVSAWALSDLSPPTQETAPSCDWGPLHRQRQPKAVEEWYCISYISHHLTLQRKVYGWDKIRMLWEGAWYTEAQISRRKLFRKLLR